MMNLLWETEGYLLKRIEILNRFFELHTREMGLIELKVLRYTKSPSNWYNIDI